MHYFMLGEVLVSVGVWVMIVMPISIRLLLLYPRTFFAVFVCLSYAVALYRVVQCQVSVRLQVSHMETC